jgi:hypothetical protein
MAALANGTGMARSFIKFGRLKASGAGMELKPVRLDWISAVPLAMTALFLLAAPKLAATLARRGWGAHLLDVESVRLIESLDFGQSLLRGESGHWSYRK